jgi:hypothetical protein
MHHFIQAVLGVLVLVSFSPSVAVAAGCDPVLKARNLPIYDQGETNTCYAFAATQVFDAWRQGHGAKVPPLSSAPEAAFRYTLACERDAKWEDVQNGSPNRTLGMMVSEGSCPYVSTHDFNQDQLGSRWSQYERLVKARREYHYQQERIDEGKAKSGWFSSKTPRQKQQQVLAEVACDVVNPKLSAEDLGQWSQFVEKSIDTRDTLTFMKTVFTAGCQNGGRLKAAGASEAHFYLQSTADVRTMAPVLRGKVDSALDRGGGSIPLISYCPNVMSAPGVRELKWNSRAGEFQCFSGGSHASVVVGRRPGARGGCEYLVRNTWGTSCNQYAYPCRAGEIWVPADELFENTYGVTWLE